MDKAELIQTMRDGHERVAAALNDVSDEQLLQPVLEGWTGKDLIAHLAWWHGHSAGVIDSLRAGGEPYDANDPAHSTDAVNERILRDHRGDPPAVARREFDDSFARLLAALETMTEKDLFASDRWPWLGGEALAETILWDSSRHYEAHREQLERLSR